jgi:hypothetical protein
VARRAPQPYSGGLCERTSSISLPTGRQSSRSWYIPAGTISQACPYEPFPRTMNAFCKTPSNTGRKRRQVLCSQSTRNLIKCTGTTGKDCRPLGSIIDVGIQCLACEGKIIAFRDYLRISRIINAQYGVTNFGGQKGSVYYHRHYCMCCYDAVRTVF